MSNYLDRQLKRVHTVALVLTIAILLPGTSTARAIDQVHLSRIGTTATAEIELGCAMRYLDHTPSKSGIELRIRLALGYDCRLALAGTLNFLYRPQGRRLASLADIEFNKVASDQATLTLRFEQPVVFRVRQTANEYMLTVVVVTGRSMLPTRPPPLQQPPTVQEAPANVRSSGNEGPSARIRRPPSTSPDMFVIRLTDLASPSDIATASLEPFRSKVLYTNDVEIDGRKWTELRLGFFDTEAGARTILTRLIPSFPTAWIAVASPDERAQANERLLTDQLAKQIRIDGPSSEPGAPGNGSLPALSAERIESLMADAKTALIRQDFDQSIKIYTRLLEEPNGTHRRVAREYLGVARQKNGQIAHAKFEYKAYLAEFPAGVDANRVQQRLAVLPTATERPEVESAVLRQKQHESQWEYYGGASQFYLRGVNLTREDERDLVTQSALLSQADIVVSRRGERFDLLGRANLGYLYDFVEDGPGDQALVSYAYVEITDNELDLGARMGRQTRHKGGVLGRFDGVHVRYALPLNLSVNVTTGFPVDSPRFLPDPNHYFYGASIELHNFADAWDFSMFTNLQSIDGISDRKAVGAEAQYHSSRLNIVGVVDYDVSYNVLNTGIVVGNWRVNDRLTVNGRYQGGAAPFMTTRNAIIGQPVETVRELFTTYSEGQIRRLARNRTAQARSGSGGLSYALSPRLQLNADVTYFEYGSTVASGGVAAAPATGPQYEYAGHLLGSSIFKSGDSVIFGYRHLETRSVDTDTVIVDMRYPVGEGLRFNPRLALTLRNSNATGNAQHWIAKPMLRIHYRWRRKYRVEFEVGGQWSEQKLPPNQVTPLAPDGSIETSAYYLQLGYWLDF